MRVLCLSLAQVLPDFSKLSTVDFAAYGFNVPADLVYPEFDDVFGLCGGDVDCRLLLVPHT